jgi:hypothetical protein
MLRIKLSRAIRQFQSAGNVVVKCLELKAQCMYMYSSRRIIAGEILLIEILLRCKVSSYCVFENVCFHFVPTYFIQLALGC